MIIAPNRPVYQCIPTCMVAAVADGSTTCMHWTLEETVTVPSTFACYASLVSEVGVSSITLQTRLTTTLTLR